MNKKMDKKWNRSTLDRLYNVEGKTLQEIGDIYGVCRERVRQVMEKLGLDRGYNRSDIDMRTYKSLEDYLAGYERHPSRESFKILRNFIPVDHCQECGKAPPKIKKDKLYIHHINYPATSLDDIQILCASCHSTKHGKNINYIKQIDIYNQHEIGVTAKELASKYNVSINLIHKIVRKIKGNHFNLREAGNSTTDTLQTAPERASSPLKVFRDLRHLFRWTRSR